MSDVAAIDPGSPLPSDGGAVDAEIRSIERTMKEDRAGYFRSGLSDRYGQLLEKKLGSGAGSPTVRPDEAAPAVQPRVSPASSPGDAAPAAGAADNSGLSRIFGDDNSAAYAIERANAVESRLEGLDETLLRDMGATLDAEARDVAVWVAGMTDPVVRRAPPAATVQAFSRDFPEIVAEWGHQTDKRIAQFEMLTRHVQSRGAAGRRLLEWFNGLPRDDAAAIIRSVIQ